MLFRYPPIPFRCPHSANCFLLLFGFISSNHHIVAFNIYESTRMPWAFLFCPLIIRMFRDIGGEREREKGDVWTEVYRQKHTHAHSQICSPFTWIYHGFPNGIEYECTKLAPAHPSHVPFQSNKMPFVKCKQWLWTTKFPWDIDRFISAASRKWFE